MRDLDRQRHRLWICGDPVCTIANTLFTCADGGNCSAAVCQSGFANCSTANPDCETTFASPPAGGGCLPHYIGTMGIATQRFNTCSHRDRARRIVLPGRHVHGFGRFRSVHEPRRPDRERPRCLHHQVQRRRELRLDGDLHRARRYPAQQPRDHTLRATSWPLASTGHRRLRSRRRHQPSLHGVRGAKRCLRRRAGAKRHAGLGENLRGRRVRRRRRHRWRGCGLCEWIDLRRHGGLRSRSGTYFLRRGRPAASSSS